MYCSPKPIGKYWILLPLSELVVYTYVFEGIKIIVTKFSKYSFTSSTLFTPNLSFLYFLSIKKETVNAFQTDIKFPVERI